MDSDRTCYSSASGSHAPRHSTNKFMSLLFLCIVVFTAACSKKQTTQARGSDQSSPQSSTKATLPSSKTLSLPVNFERRTGDLDEMVKRRNIRALVLLNPIGFFYDKGTPRGAIYEGLEEFQKFVNTKLRTGKLKVAVTYISVAPSQIEAALTEGLGDLVANAVVITPEREQRFAFSTPIQTDVTQIVVVSFTATCGTRQRLRCGS